MKPWETNFARIFLLVDAQIPANALFRPIRTKLLYNVTRSHTQVQKNSSQQWRTGVMLQCPISLVSWFVKAVYLLVVLSVLTPIVFYSFSLSLPTSLISHAFYSARLSN